MKKEKLVVIAPGRGSYTANELGYLNRPMLNAFIDEIDRVRSRFGQQPIRELDAMEKFKRRLHTLGENAAALIYACSMADFFEINRDKYDIVAIAGNSMGWYTSLACAGATKAENAITLVNTMGSMMKDGTIGGQILYPVMDEDWHISSEKRLYIEGVLNTINESSEMEAYISIDLGGNLVLAGNDEACKHLLDILEPITLSDIEYPFQLLNHAAFHTPILKETSSQAFEMLSEKLFETPEFPLIDGTGYVWQPYACDIEKLRSYTLGYQVTQHYNFTKSIEVAVKEFAPDRLVLLGPGSNLGGAIAQSLIHIGWKGLTSKTDFIKMQKEDPFVLAMGRPDQKERLV